MSNLRDWHNAGISASWGGVLFGKRGEKVVKVFFFEWFMTEGRYVDRGTSALYSTADKAEKARLEFLKEKGVCKSQATHWEYKTSPVKSKTIQ